MRRSQVPSVRKKLLAQQTSSNQPQSSNQQEFSNNRSFVRSNSRSITAQQNNQSSNFLVFSVVYGTFKPGKKHKEWTDDAILVLEGKNIRVYNLEGDIIGKTVHTKERPLKSDDTLMIGKNEYMIIDPMNKDDFLSKKCFQDFSTHQPVVNQSVESVSSDNKRKFPNYVNPIKESTDEPCSMDDSNRNNEVFETPPKFLKTSESCEKGQKSKEENQIELYQIFQVLYGIQKPGKKHKEWSFDGILMRGGSKTTLFNMDGKIINTDCCNREKSFKSDDILTVCDKDVLICDPVSQEDFESKRCFNENFSVMIPDDETSQDVPIKNSYKKVITNQTKSILKNKDCNEQYDESDPMKFLWTLPDFPDEFKNNYTIPLTEIIVDYGLTRALRDHQKEGVEFMYKCIIGFHYKILGCLCADQMGLGKTLQCITLIYTLFQQGPFNKPFFQDRVLILSPSSLVQNWSKEFDKWLVNKRFYTYAIDNNKKTVKNYLKQSKKVYPVLIISYETFHRNYELLENLNFDLIVCDEGHRLKNSKTELYKTIRNMKCERRILLTGTPIQNNLKELYSLCDLVNPGILGTEEEFHKNFEEPIATARQALDENDGSATSENDSFDNSLNNHSLSSTKKDVYFKLIETIQPFFIRRLQSSFNYLPKRVDNILICHLTDIQKQLYEALLDDKNLKKILGEESGTSLVGSYLPYISFLRRLCNHPFLINSNIIKKSYNLEEKSLLNQLSAVVSSIFDVYKKGPLDKSGKFDVLFKLIKSIKEINEKIVIVSHFTQTLDLIGEYCKAKNYKISRLDGSTPIASRQKLVDEFNSEFSSTFIFLLSSKAGGLGLNLIGASHIILYDIDWNPSHDEQSMARIFRDGQKKTANIYRLLTAGTIDEKMFQRQLDKQSLNAAIGSKSNEVQFSNRELKDIFSLDFTTNSLIHDSLNCDCLVKSSKPLISPASTEEEESSPFNSANNSMHNISNESEHEIASVKVKQENVQPFDDDKINDEKRAKKENESFNEEFDSDLSEQEDDFQEDDDLDTNSQDSNLSINLIKTNDQIDSKSDYDLDEEFFEEKSNEREEITTKLDNRKQLAESKPLSEWQHYSHPFERFDMGTVLLKLVDKISFVFRTESE